MVHMTPLCDRDVANEDVIMSVEEGGVEVGVSEVPGPSESRDVFLGVRHDAHVYS